MNLIFWLLARASSGGGGSWVDSGVVNEQRKTSITVAVPTIYGLSGSTTAHATFTSSTASGSSLTITGTTNTPQVGMILEHANIKPGTYITRIAGSTYDISQALIGSLNGTGDVTCKKGIVYEFDSTQHPSGVWAGQFANGDWWVRPDTGSEASGVKISKIYPETVECRLLTTTDAAITADTTTAQTIVDGTVTGNTSGAYARVVGTLTRSTGVSQTFRIETPSAAFTASEVLTFRKSDGTVVGNGTATYTSDVAISDVPNGWSNGYRHGAELNPSDKTKTKLDHAITGNSNPTGYTVPTDFTVATPAKTIIPAVGEIHSVVKAISYGYSKDRPALSYASCLTIVREGVTDSENKLRPHYFGSVSTKDYITVGNLPYTSIPKIAMSGDATLGVQNASSASIAALRDIFSGTWVDYFEGFAGESIRPIWTMGTPLTSYAGATTTDTITGFGFQSSSSQTYGSVNSQIINAAALRFALSDFDMENATHKQALVNYLQAANDYRGMVNGGVKYATDGGHLGGRKTMLLAGEVYLDGSNSGKFRTAIDYHEITQATPFSEDGVTYYGAAYNGSNGLTTALYGKESATPGASYWSDFTGTPSKKYWRDPYGMIDGGIDVLSSSAAYQQNAGASIRASTLWANWTNRKSNWINGSQTARGPVFDYAQRYHTSGAKYSPDTAVALQYQLTGTGTQTGAGTGYAVNDVIKTGATLGSGNIIGTVLEVVSANVYRIDAKDVTQFSTTFIGGVTSTNNGVSSYPTSTISRSAFYDATAPLDAGKYFGDAADNAAGSGRWPNVTPVTGYDYASVFVPRVHTWFLNYTSTTPVIAAQDKFYNENSSSGVALATVTVAPNTYSSGYSYKFTASNSTTSSDGYYSINATSGEISLTSTGASSSANNYEGSLFVPFVHSVTVTDTINGNSASANVSLYVNDVLEGASVSLDAVSTKSQGSGANPTWTHTPVGTPSAVAVCIAAGTSTPTSVTYGGVTMTMAGAGVAVNASSNRAVIYGLANPPAGAQSVVVTLASTAFSATCITVTGSDTATCFNGNGAAATSTGSSISASPTSQLGELIVTACRTQSTNTLSDGALQARDLDYVNGSHHGCMTHVLAANSTFPTTTVSETLVSASNSALVAVAFKKAA